MMAYWSHYTRDDSDLHNPLACPLRADLTGLPPVMIQLAELDVLYSEGAALARKLEASGVATTVETCPGVLHGFMRLSGTVDVAKQAIVRAGAWLQNLAS